MARFLGLFRDDREHGRAPLLAGTASRTPWPTCAITCWGRRRSISSASCPCAWASRKGNIRLRSPSATSGCAAGAGCGSPPARYVASASVTDSTSSFFLHNVFWSLAGALGFLGTCLRLSLGITRGQLGKITARYHGGQFCPAVSCRRLADRFHPLRMMLWMKLALVLIAPSEPDLDLRQVHPATDFPAS